MSYFPPYIDDTGLHMPTYEDRLQDLLSAYRTIFGPDAELSPAVPDYQLLSILSKALDDTSALLLDAYNSRNPAYARGQALDLLLPQYGLSRGASETDAEARNRIAFSLVSGGTFLPEAMRAAVLSLPYVKMCKIIENDTDAADSRGIPAHALAVLVVGGLTDDVAKAIFNKKAPGISTWGSTSASVTDAFGNAHTVSFTRAGSFAMYPSIFIKALTGFDEEAVTAAVRTAVTEYIGSHDIGESLNIPRLYGIIYNAVPDLAHTFVIRDIQISTTTSQTTYRETVTPDWNKRVTCAAGNINFVLS